MLMRELRVPAAFLKPVPDRSLVQTKGEDNRLDRATVRKQFHYQGQKIRALVQTIKGRPVGVAKSHLAFAANVAAVFLRMYTNIAFSDLSSGGTIKVRAKYVFWGQWRFLSLTRHKENRRLIPDFFQIALRPELIVADHFWLYPLRRNRSSLSTAAVRFLPARVGLRNCFLSFRKPV